MRLTINGLNYSSLPYISESSFKNFLPPNTKSADYIITEENTNIFVDAKAVEMPYLGKISHDPEVIRHKVKNSAIKAIQQAYELNNFMLSNSHNGSLPAYTENSFILVVTYKELYLGNGVSIYESLAKEQIDQFSSQVAPEAIIDLKNIYFITIDKFDRLMALKADKGISVLTVLNTAVSNDSDVKTHKFDFTQHIASVCQNMNMPSYINDESNAVIQRIGSILGSVAEVLVERISVS